MRFLRALVLILLVKPIAYLVLGFSICHRERLVKRGPAIIAANHNSHLDTLLLFALFPVRLLPRLRPVAAADYFLQGIVLRWVSLHVIGVLAIDRTGEDKDPLAAARAALARGDILFLFPEGSRGAPERMTKLKAGIARLAEAFPEVPVQPVFLRGAGQSLPKGSGLFVPYRCHGAIGEAIAWPGKRGAFMAALQASFEALEKDVPGSSWDDPDIQGDPPAERP